MKTQKSFTIYDSEREVSYEEYIEFCEDQEREPQPENSEDYWDYVSKTSKWDFGDMRMNLEHSKIDYPILLTGMLGLWDGRHEIYPLLFDSSSKTTIHDAIMKCATCDGHVKVSFDNGKICVSVGHHDGTNYFEIRKLSSRGIPAVRRLMEKGTRPIEVKEQWFAKIKYNEIDF